MSASNVLLASLGKASLIRKAVPAYAAIALFLLPACSNASTQDINVSASDWQQEFNLDQRELADMGESRYFVLIPGNQLVLTAQNEVLTITVLDETRETNGISTRVVEEREEKNGELVEISRNFFGIDQNTGDAFYFGQEVDFYENGEIVRHSGEWLAYENNNKPGLIIPGTPEIGMRYHQEIAPGIAMDRAEVISISETYETSAGTFENSLLTEESSPLEPDVIEHKTYAPGIGLVQDQSLKLVSYGYIDGTNPD